MVDKLRPNRRRVLQGNLQTSLAALEKEAREWRGELAIKGTNNTKRYDRIKFCYNEIVTIMLEWIE